MMPEPMAAVVRGDYGAGVVYLGREPKTVLSGAIGETQRHIVTGKQIGRAHV